MTAKTLSFSYHQVCRHKLWLSCLAVNRRVPSWKKMNDRNRNILRRHWSTIRRDLEPMKLLPYLVNALDVTNEQEVKVKATRENRTDKLLEILPRREPATFDDFREGIAGSPAIFVCSIGLRIRYIMKRSFLHCSKIPFSRKLLFRALLYFPAIFLFK